MSPGHPHVSFRYLWKSLGGGYTPNSLCVTNIGGRREYTLRCLSLQHAAEAPSTTSKNIHYATTHHGSGIDTCDASPAFASSRSAGSNL